MRSSLFPMLTPKKIVNMYPRAIKKTMVSMSSRRFDFTGLEEKRSLSSSKEKQNTNVKTLKKL